MHAPTNPAAAMSAETPGKRRALWSACLAHAVHDGYADVIYILLPLWQTEFALSYGVLALLRGLYNGAMAVLQVPAGRVAEKFGGRLVLVLGTAMAALGFALAGWSSGVLGLGAALILSGAGSSTQHPIASAAVSRAYEENARGPLGTYNFSGDLGKAAAPSLLAVLLTVVTWRTSLWFLALFGLVVAVLLPLVMPAVRPAAARRGATAGESKTGTGFRLLFVIGVLDTGVRMGVVTFLPFVLQAKGAPVPTIGLALALVFLGGAAGKFACGWLGARFGVLRTVLLNETGSAAAILVALMLPLPACVALLPFLGILLNGTSSVLYGTVPELTPPERTEHAFALFYTGTIGSGALSPVFYGVIGDLLGVDWAMIATATVALVICPLAVLLAPHLAAERD